MLLRHRSIGYFKYRILLLTLTLFAGTLVPQPVRAEALPPSPNIELQAPLTPRESQMISSGQIPVGLSTAVWHSIQQAILADIEARLPLDGYTWTQIAKLDPVDGASSHRFGHSVAMDGNTVIIGAYYTSLGNWFGSAYIFEVGKGWEDGHVNQVARLLAADGDFDDQFGYSVAISGDTAVVGASNDEHPNGSESGSAYVFEKGTGWMDGAANQVAKLYPDPAVEGTEDLFGGSVAVSGGTVVVSAYRDENPNGDFSGSAYVFEKGSNWADGHTNQVAKLDPDDGDDDDSFGHAVAMSGDTLVVAAPGNEAPSGPYAGTVYIFEKGAGWADGHANQVAKLATADASSDAYFGGSVALNGDTLIVGAEYDKSGAGSAFVFEKGAGWTDGDVNLAAKLNPDDGFTNDNFGKSVAVSGDTVVVGASYDEDPGNWDTGSTYVFEKGAGWANGNANQIAKLTADDRDDSDIFGYSVALSGDTLVVGARGDEDPNGRSAGSAYVFSLLPVGDAASDGDGDEDQKKCLVDSAGAICRYGAIKVIIAANAVSDDQSCYIVIEETSSGNFELGGRVFDVRVICNGGEKTSFQPPLKVCIRPTSAQLHAAGFSYTNLVLYHYHGGSWTAYTSPQAFSEDGYFCILTDKLSEFAIGVPEAPATGFPFGVVTGLQVQPASKAYFDLHHNVRDAASSVSNSNDFTLSIPKLNLQMPIIGVPLTTNGWDVTWLGDMAGYLEGTAFPTWAGNTAITAHVWNADNTPGPFIELNTLQHGDQFSIYAYGQIYTYEVWESLLVQPNDLDIIFSHSDYDQVTLITCKDYDASSGEYSRRLAVRAVLTGID